MGGEEQRGWCSFFSRFSALVYLNVTVTHPTNGRSVNPQQGPPQREFWRYKRAKLMRHAKSSTHDGVINQEFLSLIIYISVS